jgi:arylsulfatase A-like enzyme
MIRNKKWKYIWNTTDVDELYNLEEDPNELKNLIYDESLKDLVQELRIKLYEQLVKDEDGLVIGNEWMKNQLYHGRKI